MTPGIDVEITLRIGATERVVAVSVLAASLRSPLDRDAGLCPICNIFRGR